MPFAGRVLGALEDEADEIVSIEAPARLPALSHWYDVRAGVTMAASVRRDPMLHERRQSPAGLDGRVTSSPRQEDLAARGASASRARRRRSPASASGGIVLLPGQPVDHIDDPGDFFRQLDQQARQAAALQLDR